MPIVILKLPDDVSTDLIYPGRYMATVLPTETPQFAFADSSAFNAQLKAKKFPPGSVLLGGDNFGCGSSREQAVSCLKGHDLTIVAKSYARIFLQNGINLGLRMIACPGLEADEGDELQFSGDAVLNRANGKSFSIDPMPPSRQAITDAGGLIPYTRSRLVGLVQQPSVAKA
jgi:3-isopropylmalate/(R)-2-methylmalate dehydratase small subunit